MAYQWPMAGATGCRHIMFDNGDISVFVFSDIEHKSLLSFIILINHQGMQLGGGGVQGYGKGNGLWEWKPHWPEDLV